MQISSITAQAWQGPFILSLVCALVDGLKQTEKLASAFFEKVEVLFRDTLDPSGQRDIEDQIAKQRRTRISALVHTSVEDCRITIALEKDADLLRETLAYMDAEGIEGKCRRQVLQRRIRAIEKGQSATSGLGGINF